MILAINTSQAVHELALIDSANAHAGANASSKPTFTTEQTWPKAKDDLDRLIPTLEEMLEDNGLKKEDLTQILIVRGPGPFTALRMGVSFANALAESLGAQLYQIDTFTLLKLKATGSLKNLDRILPVLNAGGLDAAIPATIGPLASLLAPLPHGDFRVTSEVTDTQAKELHSICLEKSWEQIPPHKMHSLGEVIFHIGLDDLLAEGLVQEIRKDAAPSLVEPYYLKDPVITQSDDPWKNPDR